LPPLFTERRLFSLFSLVLPAPIWVFPFFPSTDNLSHQYNALLIRWLLADDASPFHEYYRVRFSLAGNLFSHAWLAGLSSVFDIRTAEKILLTAYVLLFLHLFRYAVRAFNPEAAFLSWAAFPMVYNWCFHSGFLNFSSSLVVLLGALGWYWRRRDDPGWGVQLGLAGWAVGLYATHALSLAMAMAAVTASRAAAALSKRNPVLLRPLLPLALAGLPFAVYMTGKVIELRPPLAELIPQLGRYVAENSAALASGWTLATFLGPELYVSRLFVGALAVLGLLSLRRTAVAGRREALAILAGFAAVSLLVPSGWKSPWLLAQRLPLYVYIGTVLWLATVRWRGVALKTAFPGVACLLGLGLAASHWVAYRKMTPYLEEYAAAAQHLPAGATLVALHYLHRPPGFDPSDPVKLDPFRHAVDNLCARAGAISLNNYEAASSHFHTWYHPGRSPNRHLGEVQAIPPKVDLLSYPRRTGGRVDYVLLWGTEDAAVRGQLESGYRLVYASESGRSRLYRRRVTEPRP